MNGLNYKIIASFLGLTAILNGVFMLLAVPFSWYHKEAASEGIFSAGVITISSGFLRLVF